MSLSQRMDRAVRDGRATALQQALLDFALRHHASPAAALALSAAQAAVADGHSCLDLQESLPRIPGEPPPFSLEILLQELAASSLVSSADMPNTPLVLDGHKLYLQRYWDYESRLAERLRERLGQPAQAVDLAALAEHGFAQALADDITDWQAVAAFAALRHRFCLISGGPGTGKTYTILRLMAVLLQQALDAQQAAPVIRLAAPTGKAAARMLESIRSGLEHLDLDPALSAHIPSEAQTLHRLIGLGFRSTAARHNRDNPVAADVVIVDEASMVDLPMMCKLLDALTPDCRLILLGDRYQLASVEAGSVLAELCQSAGLNSFSAAQSQAAGALLCEPVNSVQSPLSDHVVTLQTSRRFSADSGIGRLAACVNRGDRQGVDAVLLQNAEAQCHELDQAPAREQLIAQLAEHFAGLAQASSPSAALMALQEHGVLCSVRHGRYGSQGFNQAIAEQLGQKQGFDPRQPWYHGRPIIISRNDYRAGLYNGDTGICWRDQQGQLRVWFNTEQGLKQFLPSALPSHDSVYAMTVHKSQGSEYRQISLILPPQDSRVLSRELIYTAITRAREHVHIYGSEEVLHSSIERRIRRYSGLAQRLHT